MTEKPAISKARIVARIQKVIGSFSFAVRSSADKLQLAIGNDEFAIVSKASAGSTCHPSALKANRHAGEAQPVYGLAVNCRDKRQQGQR